MSDAKELPHKSIKIQIGQNDYLVKFPTVGQLMKIEEYKSILSGGKYGEMIQSGTIQASQNLDRLDAAAYFLVLIPDLQKDMRVNLADLDPVAFAPILKPFKKVFLPWFGEWQKVIDEAMQDDDSEKKSE